MSRWPVVVGLVPLLLGAAGCGPKAAPPREDPEQERFERAVRDAARGEGTLSDDDLRRALGSGDERLMVQALAYARREPAPGAVEAIAKAAGTPKSLRSRFAIEALVKAGTLKARRALARLPPNPETSARRLACQTLAREPDASWEGALFAYLSDAHPEIRQIAANGLRKLLPARSETILAGVRERLSGQNLQERLGALSVLSAFPASDQVRSLLDQLVRGPDAVSELAAEMLVKIGGSPELHAMLALGNPSRAWAARVLARTGKSGPLAAYRDDPDASVRLAACYGGQTQGEPAPLLLLVVVDTLRADSLSAYGNPLPASRHLDRLARGGQLHEVVRAHAPWTMASHVALFTSRYASEYGVHDVADALPDSAQTLAEALRDKGYMTAAVTSVPYLTAAYGMHQGFHWLESETNQKASDVTDKAIPLLQAFRLLSMGPMRPRGLFLFLHYFDPHGNYEPPATWLQALDPELGGHYEPMKRDALSPAEVKHLRTAYDGEVAFADQEIGRLLAWVDRLHFTHRDVIVTSDHGEELFDHGRWGHGWTLYEEQQRVPLIAALAGERPGLRSGDAQLVDLLPTIARRLGLAREDAAMRGMDLAALPPDRSTYAESRFKGIAMGSLAEGGLKVIDFGNRAELYDLRADPAETSDLAPTRTDELLARRERLAQETPAADELLHEPASLTPDAFESLRALGYLQ